MSPRDLKPFPSGALLIALLLLVAVTALGCATSPRDGLMVDVEGTPLAIDPPPGFMLHDEGSEFYARVRRHTDIRVRILALYSREPSPHAYPPNYTTLRIQSDADDEVHDRSYFDDVRELKKKLWQESAGKMVHLRDDPERLSSPESPDSYKIDVLYGDVIDEDGLLTRPWVEYSLYRTEDGPQAIAIMGSETFFYSRGKIILCEATLHDPQTTWRSEVIEDSRVIARHIMDLNR